MFGFFKKKIDKGPKPGPGGSSPNEFDDIKHVFNGEELAIIDKEDVYEVELNGTIYYHLQELEDGDFIGIDQNKKIYKITHDPFEITELKGALAEILKRAC